MGLQSDLWGASCRWSLISLWFLLCRYCWRKGSHWTTWCLTAQLVSPADWQPLRIWWPSAHPRWVTILYPLKIQTVQAWWTFQQAQKQRFVDMGINASHFLKTARCVVWTPQQSNDFEISLCELGTRCLSPGSPLIASIRLVIDCASLWNSAGMNNLLQKIFSHLVFW